ncbi:MAG TPA: spermidine/putrescine ABC transporter substrate-binding protein [Acidimicrobiia bacterium]|nr:spermidine/putrescine ABC transporter substrate-binding protein [Acidimicrobiia bacterium]
MAYHPRENWNPSHRRRVYTRRDFLQRAMVLGIAVPILPSILAACAERSGSGEGELAVGNPGNPVEQPLFDDNQAIESGLEAEEGPLQIYNWADYISPDLIPVAEEALGVDIEIATFFNEEEALARLSSGEVAYDVWFPTSQRVAVAVAAQLIQPLNHDYIPNLAANVWPQLADPYYDKGSRYTVPYVTYTTGIAWRNDLADSADIEGKPNPWDIFWNPKYAGQIGLYDSFTDTIALALLRNGVTNPSEATEDELVAAGDALVELVDLVDVRYTIDGAYVGIPEGRYAIHHAWSGDLVNSQFYWPEDGDYTVTRYLWPANAEGSTAVGPISSDTMAIPVNAQRPVLAHQFINFMLDADNSLENFGWVGYQPPQNALTPDYLIENEWVADFLRSALVTPEDFERDTAWVQGPLDADTEALWSAQWTRATSGG